MGNNHNQKIFLIKWITKNIIRKLKYKEKTKLNNEMGKKIKYINYMAWPFWIDVSENSRIRNIAI